MALVSLQTEHFRNLQTQRITFSPEVNLLYGENGSGKTSLLEAIGYLGLGRSFRQNLHRSVCSHGHDQFVVFGGLSGSTLSGKEFAHRLGFSRQIASRETLLRVDGQTVKSLSALAALFPVSVIDPGVFDIVAGGPGKRRQFLDWSVFHVEPSFGGLWQQCQRVTSQRNQALRNGRIDDAQLRIWDRQYVGLAEEVTRARAEAFRIFQKSFEVLLGQVDTPWTDGLTVEFYPGWDRKLSLERVLAGHREQELRVGHTLYGPNRADLRLRYRGKPVAETFSRGQQKTLVILMKIAQGAMLSDIGKQVTFLLDDINAELDVSHRALLAEKLRALGSQVFITSIEPPRPEELWRNTMPDYRMFHVEHGGVTEVYKPAL